MQARLEIATSMRSRLDYATLAVERFSPADVEARFMRLFLPVARRHDEARDRLTSGLRDLARDRRHRLELAERALSLSSPEAILARGYSIVTRHATEPMLGLDGDSGSDSGEALRDASGLKPGDLVDIRFSRGSSLAAIRKVRK